MKYLSVILLILMTTLYAHASGNVGFSYSQAVDDSNWGVNGDYEKDFDVLGIEIEGQLQSGDVYRGNIDASITFNLDAIGVDAIDVRLSSDNQLKGYTLDTLGRQNNLHADFVVPVGNLEFSVGVFGRNGSPFAKPSALNTLLPLGYVEDELVALGLDTLYPTDRGLTLPDGSAAGASVKGEFDISRFEMELKALLQLFGEGVKVHQSTLEITTGGKLTGSLGWRIQSVLATQIYDGLLEYEMAHMLSLEYPF